MEYIDSFHAVNAVGLGSPLYSGGSHHLRPIALAIRFQFVPPQTPNPLLSFVIHIPLMAVAEWLPQLDLLLAPSPERFGR